MYLPALDQARRCCDARVHETILGYVDCSIRHTPETVEAVEEMEAPRLGAAARGGGLSKTVRPGLQS